MNLLDQLRSMTIVVADTGDIDSSASSRPRWPRGRTFPR